MSSPGRTFPVKRYNCVLSRIHRVALTGSTGKLKDYLQKHSRIPKLVGFVARALQNVLVAQEKRPHTGKASLLHNLASGQKTMIERFMQPFWWKMCSTAVNQLVMKEI